jgi:hypothetical protein
LELEHCNHSQQPAKVVRKDTDCPCASYCAALFQGFWPELVACNARSVKQRKKWQIKGRYCEACKVYDLIRHRPGKASKHPQNWRPV